MVNWMGPGSGQYLSFMSFFFRQRGGSPGAAQIQSDDSFLILRSNAQDERDGCLAQSLPARSAEIARTVTGNWLRSIALLGSFFISSYQAESQCRGRTNTCE